MAAEAGVEGPGGDGVPSLAGLRAAVVAGRTTAAGLALWSVPTGELRG